MINNYFDFAIRYERDNQVLKFEVASILTPWDEGEYEDRTLPIYATTEWPARCLIMRGSIKWDGCIDWSNAEGDDDLGVTHECGPVVVPRIGRILRAVTLQGAETFATEYPKLWNIRQDKPHETMPVRVERTEAGWTCRYLDLLAHGPTRTAACEAFDAAARPSYPGLAARTLPDGDIGLVVSPAVAADIEGALRSYANRLSGAGAVSNPTPETLKGLAILSEEASRFEKLASIICHIRGYR